LSDYRLLANQSLYVPVHDAAYDTGAYRPADNQTVHVCAPFRRNYTESIAATLRVDVVATYLSVACSVISLTALACQFAVYMAFPVLRNTPGRYV